MKHNEKTLKLGRDYTLSWGKNKKGGKGTVVIKGKGNFKDSTAKQFVIKAVASVRYRTYMQSKGQLTWSKNGVISGTTGEALKLEGFKLQLDKRLEAIQVKLTGTMAKKFDVYYRVHVQGLDWMGWAKNGQKAGLMTVRSLSRPCTTLVTLIGMAITRTCSPLVACGEGTGHFHKKSRAAGSKVAQ